MLVSWDNEISNVWKNMFQTNSQDINKPQETLVEYWICLFLGAQIEVFNVRMMGFLQAYLILRAWHGPIPYPTRYHIGTDVSLIHVWVKI